MKLSYRPAAFDVPMGTVVLLVLLTVVCLWPGPAPAVCSARAGAAPFEEGGMMAPAAAVRLNVHG